MISPNIFAILLLGIVVCAGFFLWVREFHWKALPEVKSQADFLALVRELESAKISFERKLIGSSNGNNIIDINDYERVILRVKLEDFDRAMVLFKRIGLGRP